MKAKDIMYTQVVTVSPTATLRELNEKLQKRGISSLPVVDDGGTLVGMVTEGDLIRAVLPSYMELHENSLYLHDFEHLEERVHHVEEALVQEIMNRKVISVTEDTPIMQIGSIFLLRGIHRLPVMRGNTLVGMVGRADVCRAVFGEVEDLRRAAPRERRILVSLADPLSLDTMMTLATGIAQAERGEVLALHVHRRLEPESPLLKEAATHHSTQAPVHPLPRMGRDPGEGIVAAATETKAHLLMLCWKGHARSRGTLMGHILDYVIEHTPCDLAIVRDRGVRQIRRLLVPTAGGPHAALAAKLALAIARVHDASVTLLYVCRPAGGEEERERGGRMIQDTLAGLEVEQPVERKVITGEVVPAVIEEGREHDLVLVGATEERLFQRILFGNIPKGVAAGCPRTVVMVRRRAQ
jgi:CBS domain-containing protein